MTKYLIEFKMEDDGKAEEPRVQEIAARLLEELPDAEDVAVTALDDEDGIIASTAEGA